MIGKFNYLFFLSIILLVQCTLLQRSVKISPVTFDYKAIANNYFSPNQSKPFPLTVQRGNNLFSSTTADGRYLFYTTDQNGNYDIWFRDLQSSIVVPVTMNSFSESKPAISPDGKYLVFVSEEYDSEGDLVLLEMNIDEWVEELLAGNRFIETETFNLTNPEAIKKSSKQRVIDTDPVWSPDGKFILFVTDKFSPGLPNLAFIDPKKPNDIRQLTTDGAVNPSFSKNGDKVFFVSYKDEKRGEIYQLDLISKVTSRITEDTFLDFTPTVDSKGIFLYYSSIRKDTNANGLLDERDTNFLIMRNLLTGKERVLSSGEASYFDIRYSAFNGGSILFSAPFYNSINIYFIPESGSIPKQESIAEQYQYAKIFQENQNIESYLLGLDSIELFFSEDPLYPIYLAKTKALKIAAFEKLGRSSDAKKIIQQMTNQSINPYSAYEIGLGKWISGNKNLRNNELDSFIHKLDETNVSIDTIPSLIHILIDDYENTKDLIKTANYLREITSKFPKYHQASEMKRRLGGYEFASNSKTLPNVYKEIISNWKLESNQFINNPSRPFNLDIKRDLRYVVDDLIIKIEENRKAEEIVRWCEELAEIPENKNEALFYQLLNFLKAKAYSEMRNFPESNAILDAVIPIPTNIDLEPPGKPSVFEIVQFQSAYKNPILLRANLLKYQNQKVTGNTSDALRNMKIYLEFYDPTLGVDLKATEIENAFFYFENKALEFERTGNLLQSSFHYFFNNQNMFLVKTRNLYLDTLYKEYAVYYQRKMVDTIFNYGKKLREEEEKALLNQINILGKDKLNIIGNISDATSIVTDNKYLRSIVDLKDLEQIEVLSSEALRWTELYYKQAVPRARPHLDLATLYGYAYFLINKYVIYESYYYATDTMTDARKKEILENFKKAEWELKWIIFADPTYHDAYQLLGWLYQYVDLLKLRKKSSDSETDEEKYASLYKRFFPEKNLEENVELYSQILVFLGEKNSDPKVVSDLNLNLGNNYFLLNNYPKANECYSKVESNSKLLLSKNQFENYRQEAVFRYNYGRSLIYQSQYKQAIEQFNISIDIYFKNEYYQAVNAKTSDDNQINRDRLINVRSKLALLFSLKGLSELESQNYLNAVESFQTAIAYNKQIDFINPINLYNYLAIAFQKSGRFRDSYEMLSYANLEYEKLKTGFFAKLRSWSFWNLILSNDVRVIGEGRFPGEFPNDFKHLLTLGIGIENHIEQREFGLALDKLNKRNEFIKDRSLDKTIMGASILAKSKQIEAQIHYENKEPLRALESFENLVKMVIKGANKESKDKAIARYAASVFSLIETTQSNPELAVGKLNELLIELEDWKKSVLGNCNDLLCDLKFRQSNIRYDIIKAIAYFYLGEYKRNISPEEAQLNYANAAELLENPGEIDPREVGLSSDPLRRKERIRILYNLSVIYHRLGDIDLYQKKWKEANELVYEFRLDEESFWLTHLKLQNALDDSSNSSKENSSEIKNTFESLMSSWTTKPEIRLYAPRLRLDKFANTITNYYIKNQNISEIPSLWEERRSIDLFREMIGAQFEFEDSKVNLAYSDVLVWVKNYKILKQALEQKSERRENLANILKSQEKELKKFPEVLTKINSVTEQRSAFIQPFRTKYNNFVNGWLGIYTSENFNFVLNFENGKLNRINCDIEQSLSACLERIAGNKFYIQSLGNHFSHKMALEISAMFLQNEKEATFIFDRSHLELFAEKNERNWKWSTIISDKEKEYSQSTVRIAKDKNLGPLIFDTDVLVSNKIRKFNGSLFSDSVSEMLPLREIFTTSGSEISVTGIRIDNLSEPADWTRLGYFFEVLRSKRIQNLVGYTTESQENQLLSGNPELSKFSKNSSVFLFGNWLSDKKIIDQQTRAKELIQSAFLFERNKDYEEAYDKYYSASTLLENTDPQLPELELKLAKIKVELFPNFPKRIFFEPLWKKYANSEFQNKIRYDFFVSCYSDKNYVECGDLKEQWIGEKSDLYSKASKFYAKLRFGQVANLSEFDLARKELEKNEDPFLQAYRLGTLYIQNYLLKEANLELEKSYRFAKSPKEKNTAKNRELEILFHKGMLLGDGAIHLTSLTSTSAYSLGFRKLWKQYDEKIYSREFTKYGYADSIYDQYRKKLYQSWKMQQTKGYFDPLVLTPEYLTTGDSVLGKLSHLNRTLMFSLLKNSIDFQKQTEVNSLIDLIIEEEERENRPMRILVFQLLNAETLFLRGDIDHADRYLSLFEKGYSKLGFGNSFLDEKYNNLKFKIAYIYQKEFPSNHTIPKNIADLYPKVQSSSPALYIGFLNDLMKNEKNEYLSEQYRMEIEFLFLHMLNNSLRKNSSEVFFDLAVARDLFRSYKDRYLGEKVFVSSLPKFDLLGERLKEKMPKGQEFSAIVDIGKKSYLLSFSDKKSTGKELFLDNKELTKDILRYSVEVEAGGMETLQRDAISDKYKNTLRLTKGKRHYLYFKGIHSKVPLVFPDIEYYFVSSAKSFLENNNIKKSKINFQEKITSIYNHSENVSADQKIMMDLIAWELGSKKEKTDFLIDDTQIYLSEKNLVQYGNFPLAKEGLLSKKLFTLFSNNRLGESTYYSNDYSAAGYFLGKNLDGLFVLHSGIQPGTHNIKFIKKFFEKFESDKPIHLRMDEAKEAARNEAPEDLYWTGYRLYTSALITDD